ncbi:MAG: DUF3343 domain-containing protein [Ruminococcaceae bacterium]|nr:DUF3343 domain-containing protein [Oscillospiraceae bacterium]
MLIQVQSVTDAVRMKKYLRNRGIRAEVIQSPSSVRGGSCNFAVRVPASASSSAEKTARESGVVILGIMGSGEG